MARELAILVTARNMASGVLKDVRGDIKGIQSEAKRAVANTSRNLGIAGVAAGAALATQVHQGLQSLARLETLAAQTNAVIESTDGVANVSAGAIREQADEIERLTGIESESIQEGQNLLLTFTSVRNEVGKGNDIFNQATDTLVDMSHALGQDASQTAIQLGKALNDPIRGVTALRRVGVQLTEEQEDSIKTFMEQNDIISAQKVILQELNRQFGGSASAFGETAQGRLQKMQHAWGNLQEELARGVLPVLERVGAKLTEMFNDPKAAQTAQDIGSAIGDGLESAIDIATKLPWDAIGTTFSVMGQGAKTVLDMFTRLPPWVQTAVLTGWGLNKLSGGSLGNIVGMLGSGLVKGVLGMNAGVVNINAGAVNGGGGVGGAGGGMGILGALGLAGAGLGAVTVAGTAVHQSLNPTGHQFNQLAGQTGVSRVKVEGDLLTLSQQMGVDVSTLQSRAIPLLESGDRTWSEVVNQLRSGFTAETSATARAEAAMRDAIPWHQRNVTEIQNLNASEGARFAHLGSLSVAEKDAIHAMNASEGARAATQHGLLSSINAKDFSPTVAVTVPVTNYLSVNNFTRAQQSANVSYSTNTGGLG